MGDLEWSRVKQILAESLQQDPTERKFFLARACGDDHALRERVEALLALEDEAGSFLEPLAVDLVAGEGVEARDSAGETSGPDSGFTSEVLQRLASRPGAFDRYALEGEIARGGQGAILRVWDGDLSRNLAMKVMLGEGGPRPEWRHSAGDSRNLSRFLEEAKVTGQLDHPGIVPIHELGLDPEGRVYFTMKLVEGRSLQEIFDLVHRGEEDWTIARALGVVLKVCEAMAYAHSKGVIHRDLKPGNVMVGHFGEVYVMDWGLAKVLGGQDRKDIRIQSEPRAESDATPDSPLVTMDGDVLGTPAYMSPEQAAGRVAEMGPRSDVYAVGAVLYHLLAGHMPYVRRSAKASSREVWRSVQERAPHALAQEAATAPAELVAICERAMARERSLRYAEMAELVEDLWAYLEHRVVRAYRTGALAELRKWVERNRVLAATAGAAAFALVLSTVLYVSGITRAQAGEADALIRTRALGLASASAQALEDDGMLALLLAREAVRIEESPETLSGVHQAVGVVREREARHHGKPFADAIFSPRGDKLLAISFLDAFLWDLEGGVTRLKGHVGWLTSATFSRSGDRILTTTEEGDGTTRLWNLQGEELACLPQGGTSWTSAFSPDGRYALLSSADGTAKLWDLEHLEKPPTLLDGHDDAVRSACFSPDGSHVLTVSNDATGRLWRFDAESGTAEHHRDLLGHEGPISSASFSPEGNLIVTASGIGAWGQKRPGRPPLPPPDRTARVWKLDGKQLCVCEGHSRGVEWAVFSPSGREILTTSLDQTGRRWDLQGGLIEEYRIPPSRQCSFSPDGQLVAFGCTDGSAQLFDLSGNRFAALRGHDEEVMSLRFSPDGGSIATASLDGTVRIWRVRDETIPTFLGHRNSVQQAVFSPDGARVATASTDGTARIWDASGESFVALGGHLDAVRSVEFNSKGDRLVTASMDRTARIWGLDGEALGILQHDASVHHACFSPDGKHIATGCRDGSVWIWKADGTDPRHVPFPRGLSTFVVSVEFDPEGERLLVAKGHDPVLIVTLADDSIRNLEYSGRATFSPGGDRVLIAGKDGIAVLLSNTGELLQRYTGHQAQLRWASFSRSGERIVTVSDDGTARIWRVDGTLETTLRGHEGMIRSAVFSPSEELVLTASTDGTARTWLVSSEALLRLAAERSKVRDFTPGELLRYEEFLSVPAQEAWELLEELRDDLILKERIVAHLQEDGDLDDDLRETALRMAETLVDLAWDLNQAAWSLAVPTDGTAQEYARAVRLSDAACELEPDTPWMLKTLGAAQYREGHFEAAHRTLTELSQLPEPWYFDRRFHLLFLAMAHHELGEDAQAERLLIQVRELPTSEHPDVQNLLREAEELIAGE